MRLAFTVVLMSAGLLRAWQVPVDQPLAKEIHTIVEYCRPVLANPLDRNRTLLDACGVSRGPSSRFEMKTIGRAGPWSAWAVGGSR